MTTLVIKTNASQLTNVLIKDMGVLVPSSGGSVTFTDYRNRFNARGSAELLTYSTDNAFGVNNSTLILNNGTSDIAQADVPTFIQQLAGYPGSTGILGISVPGHTGLHGRTGIIISGATGSVGINGQAGNQGFTGLLGIPGLTGNTGFGVAGLSPAGTNGITGINVLITGNTGLLGQAVTGSTGTTGHNSIQGSTGIRTDGLSGLTGLQGTTGIALITDNSATATVSTTTASATDVLVNSMTLTPASGTYICWFTGSVTNNTNNTSTTMNIYSGGSIVQASEVTTQRATTNNGWPFCCIARVTVDGSQAIEGRWRTTGGTSTMTERTLYIQKI